MERRKFRGDLVRLATNVPRASLGCHRVFGWITQTSIEESPAAVHLANADIGVPIGNGSKPSPRVKVHTGQPVSWWNQGAGPFSVRSQRLSILIELGVIAPRPPTGQDFLDGWEIGTQQIGEVFEIRCERYDRTDV